MKCRQYICILVTATLAIKNYLCQAQDIRFTTFQSSNGNRDSTYLLEKPISLNYKETHIIIGFADYKDLLKARYEYRLLGFDNRWHKNKNLTAVNYVNLLGGDYELQIRNSNYPKRIATLKFHLEEAFWQRPWFVPVLVSYGLLFVGLILYVIRIYRLRNQIRLQQIRDEIAADLHDDVGTALSSITFLGEMAWTRFEKKPEDVRPIIERIMNESREIMQTMRGMVWVINPQNDNIMNFFEKVKGFAEALLTSRQIKLEFQVFNVSSQQIGLAVQRNLFLIFKESMVNVSKHSQATEAVIAIKIEKDHMWIRIKDNGKGFDCAQASDGNGLRNLKNRANQLGGDLKVESKDGKGTQIKMIIPIA